VPTTDDAVGLLAQVPLFASLTGDEAETLAAALTRVRVDRGDAIFSEGEPGKQLYVIREGKVKISLSGPERRENMLAVLGPGEIFGELSLFDPSPRTANATAITDTELLCLPHDALRGWLTSSPAVAPQLLQALAQRLRRTNEQLADLVFSDVPGRVAKTLLTLAERFGTRDERGIRVTHDLTQEEMAQLVGSSRESVNKALADFSSRGWLRLEGRTTILLLEPDRLSRRAG
jgi:CRP/FNR family cyclic AMP-dependent transcriptional regulator